MLSRREFAVAAGSLIALPLLPGAALAQGAPTRRSIGSLLPDDPDLVAYKLAVERMKALPGTDPRSWTRQAQIHEDHCPHGNWYFLPWHRAYLAAFERVCRELSEKPDLALPYWDWTVDRQLPTAFGSGTPSDNSLNHPRPGFAAEDSFPDEFVGEDVIEFILSSPDFETFGSRRAIGQNSAGGEWLRRRGEATELEGTPHNNVHRILAGDMGGFSSPLDPIFWLHHCNIDRLWAEWNATNANSSESFWLDMDLSGQFVNGDGSAWSLTVADVAGRSTSNLGYKYDTIIEVADARPADMRLTELRSLPPAIATRSAAVSGPRTINLPESGAPATIASVANTRSADRNTPLSIPVTIGRDINSLVARGAIPPSGTRSMAPERAAGTERRVTAQILNINMPKDPTTFIRVFVNCDYLTPETEISDPHYVTSLAFFAEDHGAGGHHDNGKPSFSVDITPALTKIGRTNGLTGDQIVVQLVAVGQGEVPATIVTPEAVEVTVV